MFMEEMSELGRGDRVKEADTYHLHFKLNLVLMILQLKEESVILMVKMKRSGLYEDPCMRAY